MELGTNRELLGEPAAIDVRARLLAWYDANRRDLPWRRTRDPYRILIAEVLLQRTRVASGVPYYERFLARFPTVRDLAAAPLDDVLAAWEGLGFYRRAKHLHEAAQFIAKRQGGAGDPTFPQTGRCPNGPGRLCIDRGEGTSPAGPTQAGRTARRPVVPPGRGDSS